MDKKITVRPTVEANFVPMPARIEDKVLGELECQGIKVSWVYRGNAGAMNLGLERFMKLEDELESQGYKGSCFVLKVYGQAEDLRILIHQIWDETPKPTPFQPTPDAIAKDKVFTFFNLADELERARKKGDKDWIDEVEFNLLPMWPEIISDIDAGCEYLYENNDFEHIDELGHLFGLIHSREHVIDYMLAEGRISEEEAEEFGLKDEYE